MEIPEQLKNSNINFVLLKKREKKPFEETWQRRVHRFNDEGITKHLQNGGNLGVQSNNSFIEIGGLNYFLVIVDFDTREFQNKVLNEFPETFTTTSGSDKRCVHLWFACDKNVAFKVKDEEGKTLADIIGAGNQVVVQPSKHDSGSNYSVVKDKPIVFFPYKDIERILRPHHKFKTKMEQKKEKGETKKPFKKEEGKTNIVDDIKRSVSMEYLLNNFGVDTSKNPTKCPFHDSVGGANLGFDDDVAHCFNCDGAWNIFSLTQEMKNCDFKEALEYLAELGGLKEELEKDREKYRAEIVFEEKKNEEENDGIIWSDNFNSWKIAKSKSYTESQSRGELVFYAHKKDKIKGKPAILDNQKKTILNLITVGEKTNPKTGEPKQTFKFIDEPYNRRDDGYEKDILSKSFWTYTVVDEDGNEFIVLMGEKNKSSEVQYLYGMNVAINNSNELSEDLKIKGRKNLFFCHSNKPMIQPLPKEEIMPHTEFFMKEHGFSKKVFGDLFFDFIFTHEDGYIYRQPKDYMLMRHAQLLSGKINGYPLSTLSLGVAGCSKTMEIECIDHVFREGVMEAGNSTVKSLVPSFKEKPASAGFIMEKNRVAIVDEFMKMVEKQMDANLGMSNIKNQLSQLNYLLEHKRREVGSGNNNSFVGQNTSKVMMVGNPAGRMSFLSEHLKVLDESTLSRFFIWIKGSEHKRFVQSNKIGKAENTYSIYTHNGGKKYVCMGKVFSGFIYNYYLTIYDSCQAFTVEVDYTEIERLFNGVLALIHHELKNVWAARGRHHTELIVDGITKWRCIFEDQDSHFKAMNKDYDLAEKILIKMAQSWSQGLREQL